MKNQMNKEDELTTLVTNKLRKEEIINTIKREVNFVDIKPYSHNIISLCLSEIANMCGQEEANKLINKFHLERLGWHKE